MTALATNRTRSYKAEDSRAAWKVPTTGEAAISTAIIATAGVQGSCTCRMSKRLYRTARSMREAICGEKFTYAIDPLLGIGRALPMGMNRSVTACRRLSTWRRAGVMAPTGAMIHGS